jgi:asparagine synthase (glutamine-hydrolysing)
LARESAQRRSFAREVPVLMCGLFGEIRFRKDATIDTSWTQRAAESLYNRGPDAGGLFSQERVTLGHRRLSILDLSTSSQQPMVDSELGLVIVFNGCIYNFRDLRDQLQAKGYRFFSTGDTEVILKAYHAWGPRCVERFFGMFAFAIWHRDSGRLFLARDRLGIKPLYLAEAGGALRFASTLPALVKAGGVNTEIDPAALHHYMSFHSAVPAPLTILKGVRKLPPATTLAVEPDGRMREETYWRVEPGERPEDRSMREEDWAQAVRDAMRRSVARRTIADVPTGALLSGGLDSSLVVALLAETGASDIKTFSVGFDAVGDIEGDEFRYSDLIAERFATDHHRIHVPPERVIEALPSAIAAMSEPMMSHDSVGFYLLSEEVSKKVKVVQSGQGADEIFGGYHWYPRLVDANDTTAAYARLYFDRDHDEMREALSPHLMNGDYSREFVEQFFARSPARSAIDKVLHIDTEIMLVDDPVKRVDNMTMAFGLEARVPFLDHEVVELAARIPAELKIKNGGKHILKEASRAVVPAEVIDRPKGYFPVPALKYIRGPFLEMVRDILNQPAARQRNLFSRAYVERLLANPEGELTPKGHSKLWQVASLELWLQQQGI